MEQVESSPGKFFGISYKSLILNIEWKFFKFCSWFSSIQSLKFWVFNNRFSCSVTQFPKPLVLTGGRGTLFSSFFLLSKWLNLMVLKSIISLNFFFFCLLLSISLSWLFFFFFLLTAYFAISASSSLSSCSNTSKDSRKFLKNLLVIKLFSFSAYNILAKQTKKSLVTVNSKTSCKVSNISKTLLISKFSSPSLAK